jgi:integrase
VATWTPHRLRHTAATKLRREFGSEAARVVLGHRSAEVTEIYEEMDREMASEVMGRVG